MPPSLRIYASGRFSRYAASPNVTLELEPVVERRNAAGSKAGAEVRRRCYLIDEDPAAGEPGGAFGGAVTGRVGGGRGARVLTPTLGPPGGNAETAALAVRAVLGTVAGHVEQTRRESIGGCADGRTVISARDAEGARARHQIAIRLQAVDATIDVVRRRRGRVDAGVAENRRCGVDRRRVDG